VWRQDVRVHDLRVPFAVLRGNRDNPSNRFWADGGWDSRHTQRDIWQCGACCGRGIEMIITQAESFRLLALNLRNGHLEHCPGAECNISLESILIMAQAAGAEFTKAEIRAWPMMDKLAATVGR